MIVCVCAGLTLDELHELMEKNDYVNLSDFMNCTCAGQSCGSCVPLLIDIMNKHSQSKGALDS